MTKDIYKSQPLLLLNVPPAAESEILTGAKKIEYAAKQSIFRAGDEIQHWYLLVSGTARLCHATPDGDEVTVHIYAPGDVIGAKGIFSGDKIHINCAESVTVCTVLRFAAEHLKAVARKHSQVAENLIRDISVRGMQTQTDIDNMTRFTAPQRIACAVQRVAARHNLSGDTFELPYPKAVLASWIGMRQETFSRALAGLSKLGILLNGKSARITDKGKLRETVCQHCAGNGGCPAYKAFHTN